MSRAGTLPPSQKGLTYIDLKDYPSVWVAQPLFSSDSYRVHSPPPLKEVWIKSYLDDLIICAPSYGSLLQRLGKVFGYMEEVGIKLNLSKCHLGQREVKFLGHVVSKEGFKPDPGNVEVIVRMKPPTNVKEVRCFLGMCGFYRKHIENFSSLASPLTNLTRKNQPFEWTEECDKAFVELKDWLTSSPILATADLT